jgi:hypothetical protein
MNTLPFEFEFSVLCQALCGELYFMLIGQLIKHKETYVVPRELILWSDVTKPCDKKFHNLKLTIQSVAKKQKSPDM